MGVEIERKFLVERKLWRPPEAGQHYQQGYLSLDPARTVRIRRADNTAFLTIKGAQCGGACAEYNYEIPLAEAQEILNHLCVAPLIDKIRYRVLVGKHWWDVDEFLGENTGLIVAEIELSRYNENFAMPAWVDREVTGDVRYFNAALCISPYRNWGVPQSHRHCP
ncbi:MAG: CYTH domain-containing protein [Deltaproteobacteria bacterium]|nr:CYTH domain-containing protein [Deltaproteobacteria bacterium]NCP02483.1 CYTH domain-containing protein [Deltaproteobacteria bacterium]NCP78575.1 CYTH domain-containing protein [Desulfuromonadales bacterium]